MSPLEARSRQHDGFVRMRRSTDVLVPTLICTRPPVAPVSGSVTMSPLFLVPRSPFGRYSLRLVTTMSEPMSTVAPVGLSTWYRCFWLIVTILSEHVASQGPSGNPALLQCSFDVIPRTGSTFSLSAHGQHSLSQPKL